MFMSVDLYEHLKKIRPLPALYLGRASLTYLEYYIRGYTARECDTGDDTNSLINYRDFQYYVMGLYGLEESARSHYTLIREDSKNDEEALYKFFDILDDYLKMKESDE